jgi:phosphoribosylamine---glycine ligase
VKASGLAGGKGAVVCSSRREARSAVRAMLEAGKFGPAGRTVVIETFLEGEEISVLALTNGHDIEVLPVAQDHKRLLERDEGPNTGGMGAYSPVALGTPDLLERVKREVLEPTLEQMRRQKTPFTGVLYAGLMIDSRGAPSVVEFNCRLGDPEAQAVLPLVDGGLTDAFLNVAQGRAPTRLSTGRGAAVTTVLASRGYPDAPEKGAPIKLPDQQPSGVTIFHAGTTRGSDGLLRVAGGRVLTATGVAPTFEEAQRLSRQAAEAVQFDGKTFRRDIGWRETLRLHERSAATVRL